ncbi:MULTISPECIES: hypothetical protein [Hyphomicrobiales]|uniref:hypothetical protein n=1 Tax=Hyphomicrobiales TaxID=356 RepID=UPI000DB111CD|nr:MULTISPECIES: hypothetical protein [Hyphomicrobiales]MCQ9147325.1 hypothetical protein [Ochrobactrum sp. BTU2]MDH1271545.1 hypothetical protein [Agrobacterium pusense]PZP54731.1 MAG: hypothetical protein DI604_37035 [Delftia acidovorans]RSC24716.1 hypothetical protein EGT36_28215 [Agrobacterium sp. FDAARGOS_525]
MTDFNGPASVTGQHGKAMQKGSGVLYNTGSADVRARIETMHRDGSVTVRALFYHRDGKDVPGYLGFKYRLWPDDPQIGLRPLDPI